jgi:hypothetical protein
MPQPRLSLVVVAYNIPHQLRRTLVSLSGEYQRHIDTDDYEVLVVDNGSTPPISHDLFEGLAGEFRLIRIDNAPKSPARALNQGLAAAKGDVIGLMIDGACLVTPGLLHMALHGAHLYPQCVVATLGWLLGFDTIQQFAKEGGYDEEREHALLAQIDWPTDGYRLFDIAALNASARLGWIVPNESNALFMRRDDWEALGGVDERFDAPGGGLVNLDTFRRAVELPESELILLLGEGTFHQIHGGISTNVPADELATSLKQWGRQYEAIRGRPWEPPRPGNKPTYLGTLPRTALAHFVHTTLASRRFYTNYAVAEPPLGETFDKALWSFGPTRAPADPVIAHVVDLAQSEFRAGRYEAAASVARLARLHTPDEPEPQRLLSYASSWLLEMEPPADQGAAVHLALGDAYRILGDAGNAESQYRAALDFAPDLARAHLGLSALRMPGEDYRVWLDRFHAALEPDTYVEIGVFDGGSLALARPPTRAIGVDPEARVEVPLRAMTQLFPETSDEFFTRGRLPRLLDGGHLGFAFIDGLHVFEQALRGFVNLEAHCGPQSVIVLHDTVPLDEATQSRVPRTQFHTGDVWKVVLCLKQFRPDLDVFTIATPPSGLTVVTGLNPMSRALAGRYDQAVAQFQNLPFSEIEGNLSAALNIVPNDWEIVAARLAARGIPRDRSSDAAAGYQAGMDSIAARAWKLPGTIVNRFARSGRRDRRPDRTPELHRE